MEEHQVSLEEPITLRAGQRVIVNGQHFTLRGIPTIIPTESSSLTQETTRPTPPEQHNQRTQTNPQGIVLDSPDEEYASENKNEKNKATLENFDSSPALLTLSSNNVDISKFNIRDTFDSTDSSNPFSNVLNSDFDLNPHKKPAPPAYNSIVNDNILSQAKQLVVDANPDQPDIADKLFKDLGDQYMFEQSLRPFNSNPSTTIPNDQQAFSEFCYGSMISCKENNMFACARNLARHQNI
jgi:hypothetical protein